MTAAIPIHPARRQRTLLQRAASALPALTVVGLAALVVALVLALAVAVVPAAELDPAGAGPGTTPAVDAPHPAPAGDGKTGATTAAAAGAATQPAAAAVVDSFAVTSDPKLEFLVQIGNRMYPDWKEDRRVHLRELFVIGDTENSAVFTKLLPDFVIIDKAPRSRTREMHNPAVRVIVYKDSAAVDSSWAFLNFPPHFSPRSFYTFQLQEISGYPGGTVKGLAAPAPAAGAAAPAAGDDTTRPTEKAQGAAKPAHEPQSTFTGRDAVVPGKEPGFRGGTSSREK